MGLRRKLDRALLELRSRAARDRAITGAANGPGSATIRSARFSVLALLAAVAVQVGLGLISEDEDGIYMGPLARLVSTDTSDKARDLHELWFNVILGLIALHVVGDHLLPPARAGS